MPRESQPGKHLHPATLHRAGDHVTPFREEMLPSIEGISLKPGRTVGGYQSASSRPPFHHANLSIDGSRNQPVPVGEGAPDERPSHRPAVNSSACSPVYLKNNRKGPLLLMWSSQSFNIPGRDPQTTSQAPWSQSRQRGQGHLATSQRQGG